MKEEIKKTVEVLKKGGIIVYPTDTIWGIGCDATNPKAVEKLYKLKQREGDKTFILLVDSTDKIKDLVDGDLGCAFDIMNNWNKPLTIVYPNASKKLDSKLIRDDGSVAIRVSQDEFSHNLIKEFGKPIVSTSANFAGTDMPLYFKMIDNELIKRVDYVVNLFHNSVNEVKASTIIRIKKDCSFEVIRP